MSEFLRGVTGKWISLSHPLGPDTPAYGGGEGLELERLTEIAQGDTANTLRLSLPNHLGTHVDVPFHFFDVGRHILSYTPVEWTFSNPVLIEIRVVPGELVTSSEVRGGIGSETDLVVLRTRHEETQGNDHYWSSGPALSEELGAWIRDKHPSVQAAGLDLMPVSSWMNRPAGRATHRAFVDPDRRGLSREVSFSVLVRERSGGRRRCLGKACTKFGSVKATPPIHGHRSAPFRGGDE